MKRSSMVLLPFLALLASCDDDTQLTGDADSGADVDVAPDVPMDGEPDEGGADDTGGPCTTDEECVDDVFCNGVERCEGGFCAAGDAPCDDDIDCTEDLCDEAGHRCTHEADDAACQNGVACDGVELCLLDLGCQPSVPLDCNDDDPCTLDRCEEAAGGCTHEPRDLDGDTHVTSAYGCDAVGGDDCNDGNAAVYPGAIEVCDDVLDNDCNGAVDLEDPACRPGNDTCAEPLVLTDGVPVNATLAGMFPDYSPLMPCGPMMVPSGPDAVFTFTLTETRNVVLDAAAVPGWGEFGLVLQPTCDFAAPPALGCAVSWDGARLRAYSLAAGTYYVLVTAMGEPEFTITMTTGAPTTAPVNDVCARADTLTPGVTTAGTTVGMMGDYTVACGGGGPDVAYRFTLAAPQDVTVEVTRFSPSGELWVDLQAACGYATSSLACAQGLWEDTTASVRRLNLAAGTYYVIVQGGPEEFEFDITLRTAAPTPAPANDACGGAVVVDPAAAPVTVDLLAARDDYVPSCAGGAPTADVFYRLVLTEAHSLTIATSEAVPAGGARVALMTTCGDRTTELVCGSPNLSREYLVAGTYYIVLEGTGVTTMDVSLGAPVVPPAFDTCAGATDVSAGGTFVGDMLHTYHDYAVSCDATSQSDVVYGFTLTEPRDVTLLLEPLASSSSHTLSLRTACADVATELRCRSGVTVTMTQRSLPAGTYYAIVAGSAVSPSNRFALTVTFGPPTAIPPRDDCSAPLDISAGGTFAVSTVGLADDYTPTCGAAGRPDLVAVLTLTEPHDVAIDLTTGGVRSYIDLRSGACGTGTTSLLCTSGSWPSLSTRSLPAGSYWVLLDSELAMSGTLIVTVGPPTTVCDGAVAINVDYASGSTFTWSQSGTTAGRTDEFQPVSCVMGTGPDMAFRLVLPVRSAVTITSTTTSFDGALYLRSLCDVPSSQIDCDDDCGGISASCLPSTMSTPTSPGTLTLDAGTYYVIQDAYSSGSGAFTLNVTATRL